MAKNKKYNATKILAVVSIAAGLWFMVKKKEINDTTAVKTGS